MNVHRLPSTVHRLAVLAIGTSVLFTGLQVLADEKPAEEITAANWTKAVGFAPDLAAGADYEAAQGLDASNWKKAAAWIPDSLALLVEKFGLKLRTAGYRPIHPSTGYVRATRLNRGKARVEDTGKSIRKKGIGGYVAGLPFPGPQNALEVAWNYHFNYLGDDGGLHFGVFWIGAERGVHREEEWRWKYISRAMHRTDIAPLPEIAAFARRDIQYASLASASRPYDKAGTTALFYRFEEPRDQRGYIYIPNMRRTLKLVFGTPGAPWNKTDMLNEDVRGYGGYPEWSHWKLVGRRTIVAPMHANVLTGKDNAGLTFDFETAPHWNPSMDWEPRPVYVVEAKSKFWTSPYGKMVLYVDAETFYIPLKEAWDKKGRLWKVFINAYNESPDMDTTPPPLALTLAVDVIKEHATAIPTYGVFSNAGLKSTQFTETANRKGGR
ncbi:MAG: DUF1329 domain-containing protein [Deltaproteobacteria bacterium]|nr:DUF1329 domain-containing protein [Deltaproteobacteria bacterium]